MVCARGSAEAKTRHPFDTQARAPSEEPTGPVLPEDFPRHLVGQLALVAHKRVGLDHVHGADERGGDQPGDAAHRKVRRDRVLPAQGPREEQLDLVVRRALARSEQRSASLRSGVGGWSPVV